jgi:hypothetical protein
VGTQFLYAVRINPVIVNLHCWMKENVVYWEFCNMSMIFLAMLGVFFHLAGKIYCTSSVFLFWFYYSYWFEILSASRWLLDQSSCVLLEHCLPLFIIHMCSLRENPKFFQILELKITHRINFFNLYFYLISTIVIHIWFYKVKTMILTTQMCVFHARKFANLTLKT